MVIAVLPESPAGEINHNQAREKINEVIAQVNFGAPAFEASTLARIPLVDGISSDDQNPTIITGMAFDFVKGAFEVVMDGPWSDTGAIRNNTGLTLDGIGTFSYYPDNSGTTSRLDMWSEVSVDGVAITPTPLSARSIEVSSTSESSGTKASTIIGWAPGEMLRFVLTDSGGGSINLGPPEIQARGATLQGASFKWQLAILNSY